MIEDQSRYAISMVFLCPNDTVRQPFNARSATPLEYSPHEDLSCRHWASRDASPKSYPQCPNQKIQRTMVWRRPNSFQQGSRKKYPQSERRAWGAKAPPGKIIAELSFDFWRFLLSSHYQAIIWPGRESSAGKPNSRQQFEDFAPIVYTMRNRCSHHESIVQQHDRPREAKHLDSVDNAIHMVGAW